MKRTLFDKPARSDKIYFLGDFPTSCNTNTAGKFVGLSAWLETPVLWKSMADVTQCEIHSQIEVSPTAGEAAKRNCPVPNPRDGSLARTHTPDTPHAPCSRAILPGQTSHTGIYFPILFPFSGSDYTGERICERASAGFPAELEQLPGRREVPSQ